MTKPTLLLEAHLKALRLPTFLREYDKRGGPRNSDSLLRWDPDQGEGVWNATEATELSC